MLENLKKSFKQFFSELKPMHFIFLGSIIAAMGSLFAPFEFRMKLGEGFLKISLNFFTFLGALIAASASIVHNWGSSKKTTNILDNTDWLKRRVTGGDSICLIDAIIFINDLERMPYFTVTMIGDVPLTNVVINIEDLAKRQYEIAQTGIQDPSSMEIQKIIRENDHFYQYPSIYPQSKFFNVKLPINPGQEHLSYKIYIDSGNGRIIEHLSITDYKTLRSKFTIEVFSGNQKVFETNKPLQISYEEIEQYLNQKKV